MTRRGKRPGVPRTPFALKRKPREPEERRDTAYNGTGFSIYTRRVARPRDKMPSNTPVERPLTTRARIEQQERELRDLRRDLNHGRTLDQERVAHLVRDIDAKTNFINQLWMGLGPK
jgi:hypothetical protein